MPRPQKDPLRPLTLEEHAALARLSRAHAAPAALVARAKALLAVAATAHAASGSVVLKIAFPGSV